MADDWDRIFETFKRPWKIRHTEKGGYRIEDANKRVLLYVYPQNNQTMNYKMSSKEEALRVAPQIRSEATIRYAGIIWSIELSRSTRPTSERVNGLQQHTATGNSARSIDLVVDHQTCI